MYYWILGSAVPALLLFLKQPRLIFQHTVTARSSAFFTPNTLADSQQSSKSLALLHVLPLFFRLVTLALLYRASRTSWQTLQAMRTMMQLRSVVLDEAYDCWSERIACQRARRTRQYDVYVPPTTTPQASSKLDSAILFLPGAGVATASYACPASMLSDCGYTVLVVSAEPLRMASTHFGYTAGYLKKLQANFPSVKRWILMGHSLGAFTAGSAVRALQVKQLVWWATAPFLDYVPDLSQADDMHVLVVQATKDLVVETFSTPETTIEFWKRLPATTTRVYIKGGTHAGFASYRSSWKQEEMDISRQEQHRQAVRATVDFLRATE
jgi:hypothetical protein